MVELKQDQRIVQTWRAFADVLVTGKDTIIIGDRVVERHRAYAVHTGQFNGVPATGRNNKKKFLFIIIY